MFKEKKGTDKPIEIFIALFVILVVAMVILKMFSSQINEQQKKIKDTQIKEAIDNAKKDVENFCSDACSKAREDEKGKIEFCMKAYIKKGLDLDLDGTDDGITLEDFDPLNYYCEDRIPCAAYRPCGTLDMKRCMKILCEWAGQKGETDEQKATKLFDFNDDAYEGYIKPGNCYTEIEDEKTLERHWFTQLFLVNDRMSDGDKCLIEAGTCVSPEDDGDLAKEFPDDVWEGYCVPLTDWIERH